MQFTRRAFLSDAVMAGLASTLKAAPNPKGTKLIGIPRLNSFDGGWRFQHGDFHGGQDLSFDDRNWRTLDLPHDWSIEGEFSQGAPARGNGGYLPTGIGWYRKHFALPGSTSGKQVLVVFDGVYQRSEVWLNGVLLGMRPYGFSTFFYDLTPYLFHPGKENVLAVRVDNSLQPNCRWYTGSGIYRHTWLRVTAPTHIAQWGVSVTTPAVSRQSATIAVRTRVKNQSSREASLELLTEILDPKGTVVQQDRASCTVAADSESQVSAALVVTTPELWGPESPVLYRLRSTLMAKGAVVDEELTAFGIREVVFDADRGFVLNGERIKLNGVCIHGDGGSVGTAVPERVWERRLDLLKEMGCNAIRLTHNPAAPELLSMLDRFGFLVMAESFDEWKEPKPQTPVYGYHRYFNEWSERDLSSMIERDRNHPSIVLWSVGNEVPDQTTEEGIATLQRLKDIVHRHDTSRLITAACDDIAAEPKATLPGFLALLDVVGYNYVDRWRDRREKYYSLDRQAHPDRRFIGTESTTVFSARGVYGVDQRNEMFFERASNTQIEVEQLERFIQLYDYVSGDFLWTGIDYLGEASWPNKLAATGPLDTCGFRKDNFFFYQSLWTRKTVLHVFPHWNWTGMEGKTIGVSCFTNCETVELLLNGQSLGVRGFEFPRPGMTERYGHYPPRGMALQTTADLHLTWDVPYSPGTLQARGSKDGKVVEITEVQTTGHPAQLKLESDRSQLVAASGDVTHITISVLDAQGRLVPTADDLINFTLHGEGRLLGLDNGRPDSHEPFRGTQRSAFNGLALAIVQASGRPGSLVLSAQAKGLTPAELRVEVLRSTDGKAEV